MSEDKSYNGWVNFETWQAALWVNNDYGLVSWLEETANELVSGSPDAEDYELAYDLGKLLDGYLYDYMEVDESDGLLGDIVSAWWRTVEWSEIAESYIEEARKEYQE